MGKTSPEEQLEVQQTPARPMRRWWNRAWFRALLVVVLLAGITVVSGAVYVARHAEPILRQRVVDTLAARFHSPVELDGLDISVMNGLQVQGTGLRILYLAGPTQPDKKPNAPPMLSVNEFTFRTSLRNLLHSPTRVATVHVQGMVLHIPPGNEREGMFGQPDKKQPKIALLLNHILVEDAKIFIETDKPGKDPMEFDIEHALLTDVGVGQPLLYDAVLTNPKPKGLIHATGHFGPWDGPVPRETPVDGDYSFDHADLNTIKGLGGTLSSTGHFAGELGHITVDGTTDTPNFSLDVSDHPLPLHTTFHAYVDGTTGDTTLDPVNGVLGHTSIVARGTVMRVHGKGHDIALDTSVPRGRIEDLLTLGMKSWPPMMHGGVTVKAKLHIPPGPVRVAKKIELAGTVNIKDVVFTNPKVQDKIDSISLRAQGKAAESGAAGSDGKDQVQSQLMTNFAMAHSLMTFQAVDYKIPGAELELHGAYGMENLTYYFMGHVRTQATASQMTTGWKSVLLKPFNKLLEKNGAGLQLPIEIHGSGSDVHFGLAMHGADETPQAMGAEVKAQPRPLSQPGKVRK